MITNENYEGYLMRYADGELDAAEAVEVEAFLDAHPDLRADLEEITSPTLRVMPPLVTMPGKERLMQIEAAATAQSHRKIWLSIAAAITLFVVAAGVMRSFLQDGGGPVTASRDTIPTSVGDTLMPDSLYVRPEKRLPVYLADASTQQLRQPDTKAEEQNAENDFADDDDEMLPIFEYDFAPDEAVADNAVVPATPKVRLIGGRVIVVETDRIVNIIPERTPSTIRPDVTRGYIVENSMLATEERKGAFGRVVDLIAGRLQRRTQDPDTLLAYGGEE